jgi:hypothetical protein
MLQATLKRPFPILAGTYMFVVQFALVGYSILRTTQHRMFLVAIPVAAAVFLGSGFLLWTIPRFWRWVAAIFFAVVILGSIRDYADSPAHSAARTLVTWVLIPIMTWLVYALALGKPVRAYIEYLSSTATAASRKRELFIGTTAVFVAVGCVVSYTAYLDHLMKVILAHPGIRLEADAFVPVKVSETRKINLGYARFSIPSTIRGDPVLVSPAGLIGIGPAPSYSLILAVPQPDSQISAILHSVSQLSHRNVETRFELRKMELAQQPFSAWQIPVMGANNAKLGTMLLALKSMEFGTASSVRTYENGRLGVVISGGRPANVFIEDLRARIVQNILVNGPVSNVDAVVSALVSDYELNGTAATQALVLRSIDSAGIRTPVSTDFSIKVPTPKNP